MRKLIILAKAFIEEPYLLFFDEKDSIPKDFAIFAILIKLSTIPIIFLPIFLYLKYFKDLNFEIFRLKFLFIYFLFITFLIQQFIFTGCIFFPSNLTCLNVSWFSEDKDALDLYWNQKPLLDIENIILKTRQE